LPNSVTNKEAFLYYLILLLVFGVGLWFILSAGAKLTPNHPVEARPGESAVASVPANSTATPPTSENHLQSETYLHRIFRGDLRSALSILLLQIIVIIIVARIFGAVFRRIGQPPVMGEMIAGIALGPSVLGLFAPSAMTFLFPVSSIPTLSLLSQLGVVLFMFVVGTELDIQHLREKASAAIMVSHASIIVPFLLGAALALWLYTSLAPVGTSFAAFALFMGIAMSITAFPVLARILEDRGLARSRLGSMALACAAIDDVSAWCMLALVIALVKSSGVAASIFTVSLTLAFIVVMLFIVRPRLGPLIEKRMGNPKRARGLLAGVLAFVLASAWVTETIGIHALFGGFLAGVVMPSFGGFQTFLKERVEAFSTAALLPLFFVFTGLRTQISLLNDWSGWLTCFVIVVVAVSGKLGGSMLTARWTKMNWHDSFSIGVLLNTRGLVELVVLNIGYDLGILSQRIFVMMVIMALATTFMTSPLLAVLKLKKEVIVVN
jgi:Kef-type K+ transport system membrane component KefB